MQKQRELPEGYEQRDSVGELTIVNDDRDVIITVHERDRVNRELLEKFPYVVRASRDQRGIYTGSFDSRSHAEDKAVELAQRY